MRFKELPFRGAYLIEIEAHMDDRGFFARTYCAREFLDVGIPGEFVQCNISHSFRRGTIRGMHYQLPPMCESKLIRCFVGAIYDVIIDLRPDSPSYCKWTSVELSANNRLSLYVPPGFAHGFQTLSDNTEVFYQMGQFYSPHHGAGVRWNDPLFSIVWPIEEVTIAEKDHNYPNFVA